MMAACATRVVAPPPVTTPAYPDFVYPDVPDPLRASELAAGQELAWQWLQAGVLRTADQQFRSLLRLSPDFYPAEAGLGYVHLASGESTAAVERFDRALALAEGYAPALAGRGEALLGLGRDGEALASFEAALAANGAITWARRRVEVLQFRVVQANLSSARRAVEAGAYDEAAAAYRQAIAASPQSAFLYRELAIVERRAGNDEAALADLQRAIELESSDAEAWREIGAILEGRQDLTAALAAYTRAAELDSTPDLQERIGRLQAGFVLAGRPAEYRRVADSPAVTRGDLAALIGVRFEGLLESARNRSTEVVTDTRGHWAAPWIFAVIHAGIMDAYPNHTFQPRDIVSRGDFALAVSRLLSLAAEDRPGLARQWRTADRQIADVSPANLSYAAIEVAIASGAMRLFDDGTFQLARSVSGAEAMAAMDRIEALQP
jgi:Tfp pilus assembly protein PilF